jgi:molecular chaperone GrpE
MSDEAVEGPREVNGIKDLEARVASLQTEMQGLRAQLEAERSASKDMLDLAKRIQADFDNFKKRAQREREDCVRAANDRLVLDLLPTLDDLERAQAPAVGEDQLRQGVRQIGINLMALLGSYGLRQMPSEGRFDPALHEAFAACEGEEGMICETYQKGYLMGNRVIRHAKVRVGRGTSEGEKNG